MGKRHSKPVPPAYPPIDPLFIPIGCSGLVFREYTPELENRLAKAPFLSYKTSASTFAEFVTKLTSLLQTLPITSVPADSGGANNDTAQASPPAVSSPDVSSSAVYQFNGPDTARLYGPVFTLVAFNRDNNKFDVYVYLPSMQKNGKPWSSYSMLMYNHRWMQILMHSKKYRAKPVGNCETRIGTPNYERWGYGRKRQPNVNDKNNPEDLKQYIANAAYADIGALPVGCASSSSRCIHSDGVHRAMGIYDNRKNNDRREENRENYGYPVSYFRAYVINMQDSRVKSLFNVNSFEDLQLNVLVPDFEVLAGCSNMLISRNYNYFMLLESRRLGFYRNNVGRGIIKMCSDNIDPRRHGTLVKSIVWRGGWDTRMVIESTTLQIYSKPGRNEDEIPVVTVEIAQGSAQQPIALVLKDDGTLAVYDKSNNDVSSNTLNNFAANTDDPNIDPYDDADDYRRRILNLIAYLRFRDLYRQEETQAAGTSSDNSAPEEVYNSYGKYDPEVDYVSRWNAHIDSLFNSGKYTRNPDDPYTQYIGLAPPPAQEAPPDPVASDEPTSTYVPESATPQDIASAEFDAVEAQYAEQEQEDKKRQEAQDALLKEELGRVEATGTDDASTAASNPGGNPGGSAGGNTGGNAGSASGGVTSQEYDSMLSSNELDYLATGIYDDTLDISIRIKKLYDYIKAYRRGRRLYYTEQWQK